MTEQATCATCRWWVDRDSIPKPGELVNEGFGECRRRAPGGMSVHAFFAPGRRATRGIFAGHPFGITHGLDWCGEHTPAEPKEG